MTTVRVTQEHIRKGVKRSCSRCPIVLALQAVGTSALVYRYNFVVEGESTQTWPLPSEAVDFISRFDRGFGVRPFEFEVDLESEYDA